MSICPSCRKFCGLNEESPEVTSLEVDSEGEVSLSVRVYFTSTCCSEEVKEYDFDTNISPDILLVQHIEDHVEKGEEYDLSVTEDQIEFTMTDSKENSPDGKNKRVWYRAVKTYYGYEFSGTVSCDCGKDFQIEMSDNAQASSFNELA